MKFSKIKLYKLKPIIENAIRLMNELYGVTESSRRVPLRLFSLLFCIYLLVFLFACPFQILLLPRTLAKVIRMSFYTHSFSNSA